MADDNKPMGPITGVSPHLTIPSRGGQAAIEFYQRAFGAEEVRRMPAEDGERLMHAHLLINGASVLLADEFPEFNGQQDIVPTGVVLHRSPQNWSSSGYGQLKDPFGHTWSIGSPVRK